ncbi:unnamed protein product [Closterium sp. NIES-64]|nr:unnamed protein product [Closterium sp. NIES-64]
MILQRTCPAALTFRQTYSRARVRVWQKEVKDPSAWVIGVIVYSDGTNATCNGRRQAWPVLITLVSIPQELRKTEPGHVLAAVLPFPPEWATSTKKARVFQEAVRIILGPLMRESSRVFYVTDPQREPVKAVPCFFGYPSDFIEQCRVTAMMQTGTKRPCCTCYVPDDLLQDLEHKATLRTVDSKMHVLRNMLACKTVKDAEAIQTEWSTHPAECVLSRWNFSDTEWGNPFGATVADIMHVLDSGTALDLLERLVEILPQAYPDHASHWRFPKIHMIDHLLDNVIMRGMPHHYSTEMWEHTHKGTVKIPVRGRNWKDIPRRIVEEEVQREIYREVAQDAGGGRQYATALREAVETMKPVLTRKGRTMRPAEEGDAVMGTYRTVLGELMDALPGSMVAAKIIASGVVAHTAMAIPRTKGGALVSKGTFNKASPKEKRFTDFAVKSGKKEEWYAKALCIFKVATAEGDRKGFVYVRWYERAGICPLTTCVQLTPSRKDTRHAVIEVESILRVAHICRSFSNPAVTVEGFVVEELTRVKVVQTFGVMPAAAFSAINGVVDTLKVVFRTWFVRSAVTSTEWTRAGVFPRPLLHDVLYKLFMAGKLTMPGTIQRSWWRAGSVPKGWLSRMDSLKGKFAAGMFDSLVLQLTSLQLVIEEFKSKCSSTAFMTAWDFVGCDENLIEKWSPARGEEDESEDEIPAYFCIPEGPLMRDSRSCRCVSRMVHDGFVKHAEALGIPPRDVPEEAGVVNEEVVSRLRRTPTKRSRTGCSRDEGITSDASDEAGQAQKAGVLFPVEDDKESVLRLV